MNAVSTANMLAANAASDTETEKESFANAWNGNAAGKRILASAASTCGMSATSVTVITKGHFTSALNGKAAKNDNAGLCVVCNDDTGEVSAGVFVRQRLILATACRLEWTPQRVLVASSGKGERVFRHLGTRQV